jgi:hypothetical protein
MGKNKEMTEADVYAFLAEYRLGVLSTIHGKGAPESAVIGFAVTPELEIIFDTGKSARKYPNLIARPECSFVVWDGERTVQYEGIAQELQSPALERYQKIYFKAFPDGPERMSWPGITYFVVRPTWIRYSDYNPGSRHFQEFSFAR